MVGAAATILIRRTGTGMHLTHVVGSVSPSECAITNAVPIRRVALGQTPFLLTACIVASFVVAVAVVVVVGMLLLIVLIGLINTIGTIGLTSITRAWRLAVSWWENLQLKVQLLMVELLAVLLTATSNQFGVAIRVPTRRTLTIHGGGWIWVHKSKYGPSQCTTVMQPKAVSLTSTSGWVTILVGIKIRIVPREVLTWQGKR
jgi:hypothetical protein